MIGLGLLLLLGAVSASQASAAEKDVSAYRELYTQMDSAEDERACKSGEGAHNWYQSFRRDYTERLNLLEKAISNRYPEELAENLYIGGLSRVRNCARVVGAEKQFQSTLAHLEKRLGI